MSYLGIPETHILTPRFTIIHCPITDKDTRTHANVPPGPTFTPLSSDSNSTVVVPTRQEQNPTPAMSLGGVPDSYQRLLSIYLPVITLGQLGSTSTWSRLSCRPRLQQMRPVLFCWPRLPSWAVLQVSHYLDAPDIAGACATNLYTSRCIRPIIIRRKWYVASPCACTICRPEWARSLRANQAVRRPVTDRDSDADSSPRGYNSDDDPRLPWDFELNDRTADDSDSDSSGMPGLMPAPVQEPPPRLMRWRNYVSEPVPEGLPWNRFLSYRGYNGWNLVETIWGHLGQSPPRALNRLTNTTAASASRRMREREFGILRLTYPVPSNLIRTWQRISLAPLQVPEEVFLATCKLLSPTMLGRLAASSRMTKSSASAALDTYRAFLPPQVLWRLTSHGTANMAGALCACAKPVRAAVQRVLPTNYWLNTGPPRGWPWVRLPPPVILRPRGPPFAYSSTSGFPRQDRATMVMPGNPAVWTSVMRRHWRHTSVHQIHGRRYHSLKLHPQAFQSDDESDDGIVQQYIYDQAWARRQRSDVDRES
jgi:hypothetical protein